MSQRLKWPYFAIGLVCLPVAVASSVTGHEVISAIAWVFFLLGFVLPWGFSVAKGSQ